MSVCVSVWRQALWCQSVWCQAVWWQAVWCQCVCVCVWCVVLCYWSVMSLSVCVPSVKEVKLPWWLTKFATGFQFEVFCWWSAWIERLPPSLRPFTPCMLILTNTCIHYGNSTKSLWIAGGWECHSSANEDGYDILWYQSGTPDWPSCAIFWNCWLSWSCWWCCAVVYAAFPRYLFEPILLENSRESRISSWFCRVFVQLQRFKLSRFILITIYHVG